MDFPFSFFFSRIFFIPYNERTNKEKIMKKLKKKLDDNYVAVMLGAYALSVLVSVAVIANDLRK